VATVSLLLILLIGLGIGIAIAHRSSVLPSLPQHPGLVAVPNVVGLPLLKASDELQSKGLRVSAQGNGGADVTVMQEKPSAGTVVQTGTTIALNF